MLQVAQATLAAAAAAAMKVNFLSFYLVSFRFSFFFSLVFCCDFSQVEVSLTQFESIWAQAAAQAMQMQRLATSRAFGIVARRQVATFAFAGSSTSSSKQTSSVQKVC